MNSNVTQLNSSELHMKAVFCIIVEIVISSGVLLSLYRFVCYGFCYFGE